MTIDDFSWPAGELNQLNSISGVPYPNWLSYTVYQPLVTFNGSAEYSQGVQQILPVLAKNWTVSPDGASYTFNLRPGVTFSNGDPFNAYQIWGEEYGFYYLTDNSSNWYISYNIFDMSHVNFGPATIALMNQSGLINPNAQLMSIMSNTSWPIYVTGPNTIVFHFRAAESWYPSVFLVYTGLLFDTQWLLQHGGFGTPVSLNTYFNTHPIPGTGPYMVTNVVEQTSVQFTQNPTYWGKNLTAAQVQANPYVDPGHVKNVLVQAKVDDISRYVDLSSGTAQISGIQTQDWPLIVANPDKYSYTLLPNNSMVFVGIALNTHRYPTNITAVRQAIEHAINYSDVATKAFFGELAPFLGPEYSAQSAYYDLGNLPPYQYNVSLAQQILKNASVNTASFPTLEFRIEAGCAACLNAAQVVQGDLSVIGINVNIEVTPASSYGVPDIGGGSYAQNLAANQTISQLTWYGSLTWAPDEPTPADGWLLAVNNQSTAGNYALYANPNVQPCVNAWTNGASNTTLKSLCTTAQAQVYHDAPYVYLGTVKLLFGGGSVAWNKAVVKSLLIDPDFSGQGYSVFNTVQFVGS